MQYAWKSVLASMRLRKDNHGNPTGTDINANAIGLKKSIFPRDVR